MVLNSKREIKNIGARSFLNKDRDAFRATLLHHARTFFADRIQDFSEPSLGGLLLDFSAEIGDHMSFYLDHQFNELDAETAIETKNIQRHLRSAGVPITGASPAVVSVTWAIEVPAEKVGSTHVPKVSTLPIILEGSILESDDGVQFELMEDLDFSAKLKDGTYKARTIVGESSTDGSPLTYIMSLGGSGDFPRTPAGFCVSGVRSTDTFSIPNTYKSFRELSLSNEDVTQVISVFDSDRNEYYEVSSLADDTVFRGIPNVDADDELVLENLEVIPAPYRYVAMTDFDTKLTTLRFGSGNAAVLNDDIIPDPSDLALPLYGKRIFSRFTLNPGQLLETQTLGVSPVNTTITVAYRHGGGLKHNVAAGTINTVSTLRMSFPGIPSSTLATSVRASVSVRNPKPAAGGEDALELNELRSKIPAARNAQNRIVTKEDLLARVYTMPSNFGRVFRAGVRSNPRNPLAAQLFIVSRDAGGNLVISPDALKKNLRVFLNQFRMISDAIDILDARVVNFSIEFKVALQPSSTKNVVLQDIISRLQRYFAIENFQIDQPIQLDDVNNIIFNSPGVMSVIDLRAKNMFGTVLERTYSGSKFDVASNTKKRLIVGPPGSIFEIRYPQYDIVGTAI